VKIVYWLLAALSLVSAGLQFNDPDPIYWVLVYSGTAVVIAARSVDRFNRFWAAVVIGSVIAGLLMTVSGFGAYLQSGDFGSVYGAMLESKPYVEETREFLGLAMSLAALVWCYRH